MSLYLISITNHSTDFFDDSQQNADANGNDTSQDEVITKEKE